MPTEILTVALGDRAYPIHIGSELLREAGQLIRTVLRGRKVAVITDETVAALHLPALTASLTAAGLGSDALTLPAGERTKGWDGLQRTVEWLIARKIGRDDLVVALGGGVIGDLAGFAAALLRRGVDFVQVPTTLLAQVDSSVGGKTGINSPMGKNLIGAFHQPRMVIADTGVLGTLGRREFLAGYGEVVKYGLLGDAAFFDWLEIEGPAMLAGGLGARIHAVRRSCEMKAEIVARDETEQGDRALLNLGHTFAHALEAATGYSDRLLHGEAVAIGCQLAFDLSARMGLCPQEEPARIAAHFAAMGMKHGLADIPGELPDSQGLIALMGQDKKVKDGELTFILARGIGEAFITRAVDPGRLRTLLDDALATRQGA